MTTRQSAFGLLAALFLLLILGACAQQDIPLPAAEQDTSTSNFTLKESTLLMSETTNEDLRTFDPESGRMVYNTGSVQLDSIAPGKIILSRPTAEAPGGFLRKVMSVDNTGDRLLLETEPANLPDAFSSYVWRLDGANAGEGRNGPEDAAFSYGDEPFVYDSLFDIPGVEDWKFRLYFELAYTIEFVSEMEYQLSLVQGQSGITNARLGLDRFSIDSIVFQNSFVRESDDMETNDMSFMLTDEGPSFTNLITIPLARFPIDPPSSLVWVEPSIRIDIGEQMKYSIEMGNRFVFSFPGQFQGVFEKNGLNAPFVPTFAQPDGMTVQAGVFFNGSFDYSSGMSIGIGIAPYSRSLFTLGARATAGPYVSINGSAQGGIVGGVGLPPQGAGFVNLSGHLAAGVEASAGLFLDADFFGLVSDEWDIERTLWDTRYPVLDIGVDNSCGYYFHTTTAELAYVGADTRVNLTVNSLNIENIDVSGSYDVYLDNVLLASGLSPDSDPQQLALPDLEEGGYTLRLVRTGGQSVLFCERRVDFIYQDPPTSAVCQGVDSRVDPTTDALYCIREFGDDNRRWFADNLYRLIPGSGDGERPNCPDGNEFNCGGFGGLYSYNDLLQVPPGVSPASDQGLCPAGFHVPTVEEWLALFGLPDEQPGFDNNYFLQGVATPFIDRLAFDLGNEPGSPNGFDALPAGYFTDSSNPGYTGFGDEAIFWTATDFPSATGEQTAAYAVVLSRFSSDVEIVGMPRTQGNSCRCVRD